MGLSLGKFCTCPSQILLHQLIWPFCGILKEFEEWPASSGFGTVPMFGKAVGAVTPEEDYNHKLQAISEENKTREEVTKRLLRDCKNQLVLMGVMIPTEILSLSLSLGLFFFFLRLTSCIIL